jgi:hypothetical protein
MPARTRSMIRFLSIYSSGHRPKACRESAVETSTGFYDGGYVLDPIKQNPNDIGRFLHVVADLAIMSNPYASNYVQNIANLVGGFYSAIDPKSAIWNKGLLVTQIPGLRYKGPNTAPVLLHDYTEAIFNSDFTTLLRMGIHGLVIDTLCQRADQYEGQSTLDGLQMTAMKSAMDEDMVTLQKRGYISKCNITISCTQAQQNMGQAGAAVGNTTCLLPVAQQRPRARAGAAAGEPRPEPSLGVENTVESSW